jgi:hypothetical protein
MKHTRARHCFSFELLRFIRDQHPTTEEFLAKYGGSQGVVFHLLRKEKLIVVEENGRIRLSRKHLSPDGRVFIVEHEAFILDTNDYWHIANWKDRKGFSEEP